MSLAHTMKVASSILVNGNSRKKNFTIQTSKWAPWPQLASHKLLDDPAWPTLQGHLSLDFGVGPNK